MGLEEPRLVGHRRRDIASSNNLLKGVSNTASDAGESAKKEAGGAGGGSSKQTAQNPLGL